ncbi:hypothetical protein V1514DRAFT_336780 [Lipomyces japonicus]|uniref:uncharacterized protein n=1 Tax=Lipomyces japonicus TaxID=56871 RepID=UPI0034CF92CF
MSQQNQRPAASAVPEQYTAKRPRRKTKRDRNRRTFSRILASLFFHLLAYYLIYAAFWKCPSDPTSSLLCPVTERITEPLTPWYEDKVKPYAGPVISRASAIYSTNAQPLLNKASVAAKLTYDNHLARHVDQAHDLVFARYSHHVKPHFDKATELWYTVWNDDMRRRWTHATPYIEKSKQLGAASVSKGIVFSKHAGAVSKQVAIRLSELSKIAWHDLIIFYDEVVKVHALRLYFAHVEPAFTRIKVRLLALNNSNTIVDKVKRSFDNDLEDDIDEIDEFEQDKQDDDLDKIDDALEEEEEAPISEITSTVYDTRTFSSPSSKDTSTSSTIAIAESISLSREPSSMASPEPTPAAKEGDYEADLVRKEINADIEGWQQKFKKAGKSAVSTLSADLDAFFVTAKLQFLQESEVNITEVKKAIQSLIKEAEPAELSSLIRYVLPLKAELVEDQALDSLKAIYAEAESIRASTVVIFKTVTDVGLSELSRKWAYTDGVTWDDWKEFKNLRDTTEEFISMLKKIPIDESKTEDVFDAVTSEIVLWVASVKVQVQRILDSVVDEAVNSTLESNGSDTIELIDNQDDEKIESKIDEQTEDIDDVDDENFASTSTTTLTSTIIKSVYLTKSSNSEPHDASSIATTHSVTHDEL